MACSGTALFYVSNHDSRSPGRDLDPGLPEYETAVLTTQRRSVTGSTRGTFILSFLLSVSHSTLHNCVVETEWLSTFFHQTLNSRNKMWAGTLSTKRYDVQCTAHACRITNYLYTEAPYNLLSILQRSSLSGNLLRIDKISDTQFGLYDAHQNKWVTKF
jgi:hypothetical protein